MCVTNSMLIYHWLILMFLNYSCALMVPLRVPFEPYMDSTRNDDEISTEVVKDCDSMEVQMYCMALCGEIHACVFGKCYCVQPYADSEMDRDVYNKYYYIKQDNKRDSYYADSEYGPEERYPKGFSKRVPYNNLYEVNENIADDSEVYYSQKQNKRDSYGDMYVDNEILHAPEDYYPKKYVRGISNREQFDDNKAMDQAENYSKQKIRQHYFGDINHDDEAYGGKALKYLLAGLRQKAMAEKTTSSHTALRHHIAHFCPNLDEARVCIRKCMKRGKPAFCGKDHTCYCGHNLGKPVNDNDKETIDGTYREFRDMYKKYLGI